MQFGVDTCSESRGLWVIVQAVQTQQEELAQKLDATVLQVQEQMRVINAKIDRTQHQLAADRRQRGESEGIQALPNRGPSVSTVGTPCSQEDVHRLPFECEAWQQKQQDQQVDPLKYDNVINDIADKVCEMFAGPLSALTESVRRAESDMENLRSALFPLLANRTDVQQNQDRLRHGSDELQVAMGKLDKMVYQMKTEESHSKQSPTNDSLRSVGSGLRSPPLSRPMELNLQEASPPLDSEDRRICNSIASKNDGEERKSIASTCGIMQETPELWKRIYARS
jgi:hypothetical protein